MSKEAYKKEEKINKNIKKLINIGIIGNSKSIGISWIGLLPCRYVNKKTFLYLLTSFI